MPKSRRKINLPLLEIIIGSLILHIVGLLILGGITIFNQIKPEEQEFIPPPVADNAPPPVKLPPLTTPKNLEAAPDVVALSPDMPMPDLAFDMPTVEQRVGVGAGIGSGISGNIMQGLKLPTIGIFGKQDQAESVCFIVDYSLSMKDKIKGSNMTRMELLKEQLTASLSNMPEQMVVSVIFFSGPAWVAGESEKAARKKYTGKPGDWHSHRPKDINALTKPVWNVMSPAFRNKIIDVVKKEKMTGGTVWSNPLRVARMLEPAPEVIFFMTDGATSDEDVDEALALVSEWKRENRDLRIHTFAIGEPKAASGMKRIANSTRGDFKLIESLEDIERQDADGRNDS